MLRVHSPLTRWTIHSASNGEHHRCNEIMNNSQLTEASRIVCDELWEAIFATSPNSPERVLALSHYQDATRHFGIELKSKGKES